MADIDALIERLFPFTTREMLRDLAGLDFSFVVPSKVSQTVDILPNMHADISVAERFNVTLRTIRERARSRNLGRTLDGTRWFTEAEILGLMTEGGGGCSNSRNGGIPPTSMRGERFSTSPLTKALELATDGKPKPPRQDPKRNLRAASAWSRCGPRKRSQAPR